MSIRFVNRHYEVQTKTGLIWPRFQGHEIWTRSPSGTEIEQLTSGIKKFVFQAPNAADLPSFSAGATLICSWKTGSSNPIPWPTTRTRPIAMLLPFCESRRCWLDLHADEVSSEWGDAHAAAKRFEISDDASQHIFLAGGIGITRSWRWAIHWWQRAKTVICIIAASPSRNRFYGRS